MLAKLQLADLSALLKDNGNEILDIFLKNPKQLLDMLAKLQLANLKNLLTNLNKEILAFRLKNPEHLIKALSKIESADLNDVLETDVEGNKVREHINNLLNGPKIVDPLRIELLEILLKEDLKRLRSELEKAIAIFNWFKTLSEENKIKRLGEPNSANFLFTITRLADKTDLLFDLFEPIPASCFNEFCNIILSEILDRDVAIKTSFIRDFGNLVEVLSKLQSGDLNQIFKKGKSEILNLLGANRLIELLLKLNSADLSALLMDKGNEILAFFLTNKLGQLLTLLLKLNHEELNNVLVAGGPNFLTLLKIDNLVKLLSKFKSGELAFLLGRGDNGVLAFFLKKT
jgi:hypothetical protein